MIKTYLLLIGVILTSVFACTNTHVNKQVKIQNVESTIRKEKFDQFYKRFHTDNKFQISRITFPLDGYLIDENYNPNTKEKTKFHWNKADWEIHTMIKETKDLKITKDVSDSLVVETISIPNSGFEIVRKFKLINDTWFLVFYGEKNL